MTKLLGVIGYPLKHSISPHFQQAALDHYSLDAVYEAWETEPHRLERVINRLREPAFLGANVTIPYKEQVMPFLDDIDSLAREVNGVNTIVNRDGKLFGYNTDVAGFMRALKEHGGFYPPGKRAVVVGAGGAARAVIHALIDEGINTLVILNRTLDKAQALVSGLKPLVAEIQALPLEDGPPSQYDLLVNCTPMGMKHAQAWRGSPVKASRIVKGALIYDLVYNPRETPLIKSARKAGARTIGGLPMLVYQGAVSFELWTGKEAPVDVMFAAAREAL